jgi:hypothetical protein
LITADEVALAARGVEQDYSWIEKARDLLENVRLTSKASRGERILVQDAR